MKVILDAPILTQSGYGEHSRLVFRALQQIEGVDIYINPLNWGKTGWISDDTEELQRIEDGIKNMATAIRNSKNTNQDIDFDLQVQVGIPSEFVKKAPYSICVTAGIESDRISPEWVMQTHKGIDKIIVPSNHAAKGFKETSFEVSDEANNLKTILSCNDIPISVVPYPVKMFNNTKHLDFNIKTKFNFLSIGLLGTRKNLHNLIDWFIKEYKDDEDTGLILKVSKSSGSVIDKEKTRESLDTILSKHKDRKCKIYLLHGDLSEEEIHSLYLRDDIHAYVTTTHGEGYGLPIFEAAYSGMPVIATNWSGHLDFLSAPYKESGKIKNKDLFAKIDFELKEIPSEAIWDKILIKESKWAYPKENSFRSQIRKVKQSYGMYKKWSKALKEHLAETHNVGKITEQLKNEILESFKQNETKGEAK